MVSSTPGSPPLPTRQIHRRNIVGGRTLGVRVDIGWVGSEVDSVVEAWGLGKSTSDMGSYLGGGTSVEEGGVERLDVAIHDLVGLGGGTIESSVSII